MCDRTSDTGERFFRGSCILRLLGVGVALLPLAACASMEAKASLGDRPALMVPPPPAHVIEAAPEPEPEPEPVSELPPTPPPPNRTKPAPRPAAPQPADPKPVEQPPTEPPVAAPPATPPAQLRTPQTADTGGAVRTAHATIENAKSILKGVNYGPLSNDRKKAYDQVNLFLKQAEEALKEGNLVFAQAVANKAETLAKELAGR